jgi:hypothetical protein
MVPSEKITRPFELHVPGPDLAFEGEEVCDLLTILRGVMEWGPV